MFEFIGGIAILIAAYLLTKWIRTRNRYAEYCSDCELYEMVPISFAAFVEHEAMFGISKKIGR